MRTPVVLALLCAWLATPAASIAANFAISSEPHVQVDVNMRALQASLAPLQKQDYYAAYENNGLICTTGNFSVGTDAWEIAADPWWSSVSDTSSVVIGTRLRGHVRVRNCLISLRVNCSGNVLLQKSKDDIEPQARCRIWGGIAGFKIAIPQPARIPDTHELVLKHRTASQQGIQLEFGELHSNGAWIRSQTPFRKTIRTSTQLSGARGRPVYWALGRLAPEALSLDNAEILSLAVSIGQPPELIHASEAKGLDARSDLVSVATNDFVGLSISPHFLGSRSKEPGASGLFGQALPIKASVATRFLGGDALAEVIFDEAAAGSGSLDGKPVMIVDLKASRSSLKTRGSEFAAGAAAFRLIVTPPEVNSEGRVVTKLLRTQFAMDALAGLCICLNHDAADSPLETTIYEIAELRPKLSVRFPDCIEMDSDRFKPANSRFQRISCPTPPAPGKGQIARDSKITGVTVTLDLGKFQPRLRAGRFVYSVPYQLDIEARP